MSPPDPIGGAGIATLPPPNSRAAADPVALRSFKMLRGAENNAPPGEPQFRTPGPAEAPVPAQSFTQELNGATLKRLLDLAEHIGPALESMKKDAQMALGVEIQPTASELEAFRNDPTVQEMLGDNGLLENDDATSALMMTLGNERENPSGGIEDNPVLKAFGLTEEDTAKLAQTQPIDELNERSKSTIRVAAGGVDDYLADNPEAEIRPARVQDDKGQWHDQLLIVDEGARTPEEQQLLAEANEELQSVVTEASQQPMQAAAPMSTMSKSTQFIETLRNESSEAEVDAAADRSTRAGATESGRVDLSAESLASSTPESTEVSSSGASASAAVGASGNV